MHYIRLSSSLLAFVFSATCIASAQTSPAPPTIPNVPINAPPASPGGAAPSGQAPRTNTIMPGDKIEPGDQLSISVYGDQTLTVSPVVGADGAIFYPLIGRVVLAGKTPAEAATLLAQKLHQYVKEPRVTVSIAQAGEEGVLVLGNVKTPGKYAIRSGGHLSDAIAAAGGLGPTNGDLPTVRITQSDGSVNQVSLQKLLHDGDASQNVAIQHNAVVYVVAPNSITVDVVGAVDHPGAVQIDEGDRLSMAIARAGTSANAISDLNHVVITRTDASGKTTKQEVNMYNALQGGDRRFDPVLAKGDVVYVPMGKRPGGSAVLNPLSLITRLIGI